MNTRLIVPLLIAGALAFACGPRTRSEAPATLASRLPVRSALVTVRPHGRHDREPSTTARVTLESQLDIAVAPREITFALNVTNTSTKHAEIDFTSGHAYDFVVVDSVGREVWRWSTGRLFTQSVQNKQLGSGESMRVSESWKPQGKAGHYIAIATLKSSNFPIEQRAEFVVK